MADDEFKALREEIASEFRALREEVAKLREQLAERYGESRPAIAIDWTKPIQVGTPAFVPSGEPIRTCTIICKSGAFNG